MSVDWTNILLTTVSIIFSSGVATLVTLKQALKSSKLNVVKEELEVARIHLQDGITEAQMLREEIVRLIEQCKNCNYKSFYYKKRKELNDKINL